MGSEKDFNQEGDVVLIYYQDKPSVYARIESIVPDIKKDWYQVTLLMLTIPAQATTWILREEYINGTPYTMGGQPLRIEKVEKIELESLEETDQLKDRNEDKKGSPKVIPIRPKTT
jgi:hypothetical protein